jgi:hypothetical protein
VEDIVVVPPVVDVNVGISVFTSRGVRVKDEARGGVGEKIWFANGLPYTAEATVSATSTNEAISHCRPATIRSRRVRKKTTVRAACSERIPARAASNAAMAKTATMTQVAVLLFITPRLYCLLSGR